MAREGSPRSPYWVIVCYDWSDPRVIRWTELETNHGDPGDGFMRLEPRGVGQTGRESWDVLADPEGNEFCVVRPKVSLVH